MAKGNRYFTIGLPREKRVEKKEAIVDKERMHMDRRIGILTADFTKELRRKFGASWYYAESTKCGGKIIMGEHLVVVIPSCFRLTEEQKKQLLEVVIYYYGDAVKVMDDGLVSGLHEGHEYTIPFNE